MDERQGSKSLSFEKDVEGQQQAPTESTHLLAGSSANLATAEGGDVNRTHGSGKWSQSFLSAFMRQDEPTAKSSDYVAFHDSMTYRADELASWSSLLSTSSTVWNRWRLWEITLKLLGLSLLVALLTLAVVQNPSALKIKKFQEISTFLRAFVGFLLGFFMASAVQRWWACAEGFQKVCTVVKALHLHMNAVGVPKEDMVNLLRYGVVSIWILHLQLHAEAEVPEEKMKMLMAEAEEDIEQLEPEHDQLHPKTLSRLTDREFQALSKVRDPTSTLWMWIGSMIGHFSVKGVIPPLASPTYGRFIHLAEQGAEAIHDVKCTISIQAPFIYIHMLSSLVHINNIINAISFGMTAGSAVGTMLEHFGWHQHEGKATHTQVQRDSQDFIVSFFFCCFGPIIYQALLEVGIAIAQPFSSGDALVPTERIAESLERDLHDAMRMMTEISWPQPCFQKPSA